MKAILIFLGLIFSSSMAASYSWNNDMELSYKDIQGLRVQEDLRENIRVVRITGLVFHSGLAISKITKITKFGLCDEGSMSFCVERDASIRRSLHNPRVRVLSSELCNGLMLICVREGLRKSP